MTRFIEADACTICEKSKGISCIEFRFKDSQRLRIRLIDTPGDKPRNYCEPMYKCPVRLGLANALRDYKKVIYPYQK